MCSIFVPPVFKDLRCLLKNNTCACNYMVVLFYFFLREIVVVNKGIQVMSFSCMFSGQTPTVLPAILSSSPQEGREARSARTPPNPIISHLAAIDPKHRGGDQRGMAPPPRLPAGAAALLLMLAVASRAAADGNAVDVGVNWGSQLSHPLLPKSVVQMLKENGILKVKLFDADPWPVGALVDSGIEVMLGIPNDMLETMNSYGNAQDWVKENVTSYGDKLKIK